MAISVGSAHAQGYDFSVILRTGASSGLSSITTNAVVINNAGQLAFRAEETNGTQAIFRIGTSGANLTRIADNAGTGSVTTSTGLISSFRSTYYPGLSDTGVVSFWAQYNVASGSGNGVGIFTGTGGGAVSTVARSEFPSFQNGTFLSFTGSDVRLPVNSAGQVAFYAEPNSSSNLGNGVSSLYVGSGGGSPTLVANNAGVGGTFQSFPYNSIGTLGINDAGRMLFTATRNGTGRGLFGITPGGTATLLADSSAPGGGFSSLGDADLNGLGTTAFVGTDAAGIGLFTANAAGDRTRILNSFTALPSLGVAITDYANPNLNDAGTFAFSARPIGFGGRLFTFNSASNSFQSVVGFGDAFGGSTIQSYGLSSNYLNNAGQIVFNYTLTNGEQGIAVATPRAIAAAPEPASVALAALGLAGLTLRARRRPRRLSPTR